ncbi:MAG: hypothetical protein U0556_08240 [Dehalococcoidia bacterium]
MILDVRSKQVTARLDGEFFVTSWSPDSQTLAVVYPSPLAGGRQGYRVMTVRYDGSGRRELLAEGQTFDGAVRPYWSSDGATLSLAGTASGQPVVSTVGADGTGLRRLAGGTPDEVGRSHGEALGYFITSPPTGIWFPGSRRLLTGQILTPAPRSEHARFTLESVDVQTGAHTSLSLADRAKLSPSTNAPPASASPADAVLSADGHQLAYAIPKPGGAQGEFELWVSRLDGSSVRQISTANPKPLCFSRNSAALIYWREAWTLDPFTQGALHRVDLSTGVDTVIVRTAGVEAIRWAGCGQEGSRVFFLKGSFFNWQLFQIE